MSLTTRQEDSRRYGPMAAPGKVEAYLRKDTLITWQHPDKEVRAPRARMTGSERRHQLIDIASSLFAERGYEGTSIEEIAQRANVSKPVVYEHFGGKEGLYAVVVDREMSALLDGITSSLTDTNNRSRRARRAGRAGAAHLRRRTHRRLPHPDPRLAGRHHARAPTPAAQRRRQPGVVDPGRRLLPPRPRPRHGAAVRPGAGRARCR